MAGIASTSAPGPWQGPANYPPTQTAPTYPATYAPQYGMYAPAYAKPPSRFTPRLLTAASLGMFGILLLLIALFASWWSVGLTESLGGLGITFHVDFGLFGGSANLFIATFPLSYANQVASVFLVTSLFTLVGVLLSVLSVILGLVSTATSLRRGAVLMSVVAFILLVAAPLYLAIALPGAQSGNPLFSVPGSGTTPSPNFAGFWGSGSIDSAGTTLQLTWGAGLGWYLSLIAGALVLFAGLLMNPSRTIETTPTGYGAGPVPPSAGPAGTPPYGPTGPSQPPQSPPSGSP